MKKIAHVNGFSRVSYNLTVQFLDGTLGPFAEITYVLRNIFMWRWTSPAGGSMVTSHRCEFLLHTTLPTHRLRTESDVHRTKSSHNAHMITIQSQSPQGFDRLPHLELQVMLDFWVWIQTWPRASVYTRTANCP